MSGAARALRGGAVRRGLAGLALFVAGCASDPPVPVGADLLAEEPPPAPVAPIPPGARLVTDTSDSMRGFTAKGAVRLATLHEELDGALATGGAEPRELCLLSSRQPEGRDCAARRGHGHYAMGATYGGESRFDLALDLDADDGPRSRRFTVVVTDGVYGGPGGSGADRSGCASGTSVACISDRLARLAAEGFGVWALALTLPFDGPVYAERAMGAEMFERIQGRLPPGAVVSGFRESNTSASYNYKGGRPLLVLVASRDVQGGRALVADLAKRLSNPDLGLIDPSRPGVKTGEWSPTAPEPARITGARAAGDVPRTPGFLPGNAARQGEALVLAVQCGAQDAGAIQVGVEGRVEGRALRSVDAPEGALLDGKPYGDGYIVGLRCDLLSAGRHQLALELRAVDPVADATDAWLADWSAPDTWSRPDGLPRVAEIASAVIASATAKRPPLDRLVLSVERR